VKLNDHRVAFSFFVVRRQYQDSFCFMTVRRFPADRAVAAELEILYLGIHVRDLHGLAFEAFMNIDVCR